MNVLNWYMTLNNVLFLFVSNPVLHLLPDFPVLPTVKEQRSLAKLNHHCCDKCGKHFPKMSNLKIHQRMHSGEKPYGCDQCGKLFSKMSNLEIHQQIHTGVRPKSVWKSLHLHVEENPHGCDQCGKHFSKIFNLKIHQKIHSGARPKSVWMSLHLHSQSWIKAGKALKDRHVFRGCMIVYQLKMINCFYETNLSHWVHIFTTAIVLNGVLFFVAVFIIMQWGGWLSFCLGQQQITLSFYL